MDQRANLDAEDLLKLILVLVAAWLVLGVLGKMLDLFAGLLGLLPYVLGIVVVVLVILWLLDRI